MCSFIRHRCTTVVVPAPVAAPVGDEDSISTTMNEIDANAPTLDANAPTLDVESISNFINHAVDCKDYYRNELKNSINKCNDLKKSTNKHRLDVKLLTLAKGHLEEDIEGLKEDNKDLKDELKTKAATWESDYGKLLHKYQELEKDNNKLTNQAKKLKDDLKAYPDNVKRLDKANRRVAALQHQLGEMLLFLNDQPNISHEKLIPILEVVQETSLEDVVTPQVDDDAHYEEQDHEGSDDDEGTDDEQVGDEDEVEDGEEDEDDGDEEEDGDEEPLFSQ